MFGFARNAFAEYVCGPEDHFVLKPPAVSFEEGAAIGIAATTALQGLREGKVQRGQKVLIDGASGGVGTFAVQIAKSFGAEVTAVCGTQHLDQARAIGADHVIDYTREDVTKGEQVYDLVLAVNGYHSLFSYRRILTPKGAYIMIGSNKVVRAVLQTMILGRLVSRKGGKRTGFFVANLNNKDLVFLRGLMEEGKVRPVIDKRYPLSETAEAFRYLGGRHAAGKIVVVPDQDGRN